MHFSSEIEIQPGRQGGWEGEEQITVGALRKSGQTPPNLGDLRGLCPLHLGVRVQHIKYKWEGNLFK
jgi:hypothetical protein